MIAPESSSDPNLRRLVEVLLEWLNDVLAPDRIIVRDMEEDLYDGCVLHKLIGRHFLLSCVITILCKILFDVNSQYDSLLA